MALLTSQKSGRQERNTINNKDLETKLFTHKTTGDVALTNISRETNYFHGFAVSKIKVLPGIYS